MAEDYYGTDAAHGHALDVVQVSGKTPAELHQEITDINREIAGLIGQVKENPVLIEFVETIKVTGPMGLMGLLPKIGGIIPELSPLVTALQKLIEVGEKQHELTGELVKQLEGLKNA